MITLNVVSLECSSTCIYWRYFLNLIFSFTRLHYLDMSSAVERVFTLIPVEICRQSVQSCYNTILKEESLLSINFKIVTSVIKKRQKFK